ncbi:MAG: PEGA domain-containing protein [bacterium]|nr:PEGA domain-containing protein [bacterium]
MKKFEKIIFTLVGILFVFGLIFFLLGHFKPKKAGILIETVPTSLVYINGVQVGRTPYEATMPPSEVVIKLIPESLDKPLVPYETKVNLESGIKTVIKREFGESDETSAGEVVSFEKVGVKETSLAVVSIPDSAQVSIDGQIKGFAPTKITGVALGEHQIAVSAERFKEKTLTVKAMAGYKLTAVVKLALNPELPKEEVKNEQIKEPEKTYQVEILTTPNGFLRVRSEPAITAGELTKVKTGERFEFIGQDEKTGWFEIEYEAGKEGWVSNDYAKKIEAVSN